MPQTAKLPAPAPSAEDVYEIHALRYAHAPERRVHDNFMYRDMHDGPMRLDFFVWIVRNQHRTILVDTGFSERAARERGRPLDIDPVEALGRIGIDPDGIEDIVVTHLHFDHAGNIDRFAKARFHIQESEVNFATGRCMCDPLLRWPFDIEDVVALIRRTYADRVVFHDGDASPFPGITLHCLPGHSLGMQAMRVNTARGPILLASDTSHYYANFLRAAPFRLTVDAVETLRSYKRLVELTGGDVLRIIPGHDPKVRAIYPGYTYSGIELTALHEPPRPFAIEDLKRVGDL